jgi:hypothetical protein
MAMRTFLSELVGAFKSFHTGEKFGVIVLAASVALYAGGKFTRLFPIDTIEASSGQVLAKASVRNPPTGGPD